ncbi:MAG: IclR family transcriptional regulator [Pseudoclavibacter sp.]
MPQDPRSVSTTFSRGLALIELLSRSDSPRSVADLAEQLGLSRTVVYRLLQTLDEHGLLAERRDDGKLLLGLGLLTWARNVEHHVRELAMPILRDLAESTAGTAFIGVLEGHDVVCLASAEPRTAMVTARYREGIRNPVSKGASGAAVRSIVEGEELSPGGYAISRQEVETGFSAIAVPLQGLKWPASLTLCFPSSDTDVERHSGALLRSRDDLERRNGRSKL